MTLSEDHICFRMLCFHVNQARFIVSAENCMKVLFLTYVVVRSYEHDREDVAVFLNPCNRMGATSISWPSICLRLGIDPTTWTNSLSSSALLQPWTAALQLHTIAVMSLRNFPSSHSFSPVATQNTSFLGCTSPRMTWYCHSWCSARDIPLKFGTTVPHPKRGVL